MGENLSFVISAIDRASAVFSRVRGSVVGLLSSYFSLRAISSQVSKAIDYADQVQDMAQATGLSASAFQALAIAAKESGASQEQLIAIMMKLKAVQAEIGSNKQAQGYFANMGLTVEAVKKAAPSQLLQTIADRMRQAGGAADVFGLMGERLGPRVEQVLKRISEVRLDGLVKSMQQAGQIMSDMDVQNLAEAKDALDRLGRKITIAVGLPVSGALSAMENFKESPAARRYRNDSEEFSSFTREERSRGRQILREKGFDTKDFDMSLLMTAYRVARKQIGEENDKTATDQARNERDALQKKELAAFRMDISIRDAEVGQRKVLLREKLRQLKAEQSKNPEKSTELEKQIIQAQADISAAEKEIALKARQNKEARAKDKEDKKKSAQQIAQSRGDYRFDKASEQNQLKMLEARMKALRKIGTDEARTEFYQRSSQKEQLKKTMADRAGDSREKLVDLRSQKIESTDVSTLFDRMYAGGNSAWNRQDQSLVDYAKQQADLLKIIADNSQGVR